MIELIGKLIDWFWESPIAQAATLTVVLAVLRIAYDDKETTWTRISIEGGMSGLLVMMFGKGMYAAGLPLEWSYIFGGFVASIGIAHFRKLLLEGAWIRIKGDNNGQN